MYIAFAANDARTNNLTLPARFFIGIESWGRSASFSLIASSSAYSALPNAFPIRAHAEPWAFSYFTFVVPDASSPEGRAGIEFSATSVSGSSNLALYVSNSVDSTGMPVIPRFTCHPTTCGNWAITGWDWSSTGQTAGRQRISISPSDPKYKPGQTYLLAVLPLGGSDSDMMVTGAFASE